MIFVNTVNPYLRILDPASGDYIQFLGGRLELDEGDPGFAAVKAEAERNPSIAILVNSTTCELCGEVFTGKMAKAHFGAHKKEVHFDVWQAERELDHARSVEKEVKSRAGYACDVCQPAQVFGSPVDLSEHVKLLHATAPELDDEGNDLDDKRRPGETSVPAAKRKGA